MFKLSAMKLSFTFDMQVLTLTLNKNTHKNLKKYKIVRLVDYLHDSIHVNIGVRNLKI